MYSLIFLLYAASGGELDPKRLKNLDGQQIDKKVDNIPWKDSEKRVIDINSLTNRIKEQVDNSSSFTSAQLALEMIEGVEKVRFIGS